MTRSLGNSEDIIDVRAIIARVEQLEGIAGDDECHEEEYDAAELRTLSAILSDLESDGGDERWRGNWYPALLIRDSYLEDYARELAEAIGAIDPNATWPNNCIDWGLAASELQSDYSSVEYEGVTYWHP